MFRHSVKSCRVAVERRDARDDSRWSVLALILMLLSSWRVRLRPPFERRFLTGARFVDSDLIIFIVSLGQLLHELVTRVEWETVTIGQSYHR